MVLRIGPALQKTEAFQRLPLTAHNAASPATTTTSTKTSAKPSAKPTAKLTSETSATPTTSPGPPPASVRNVLVHLIAPLLMCAGMGLAYMSVFMAPHPHHVKVAVIGEGSQALPTTDAAVAQLHSRDLVGAFVPDPAKPQLYIAEGDSGALTVGAAALAERRNRVPEAETEAEAEAEIEELVAV